MLRPKTDDEKDDSVDWQQGWPLLKRFWPNMRSERRAMVVIAVLLTLAIPSGVFAPFLIQQVYDVAIPDKDFDLLVRLAATILGLTLFAHVLRMISSVIGTKAQNRVKHRFVRRIYDRVMRLPLRYFHKTETGYVMARIREDVDSLNAVMAESVIGVAVDVVRMVLFLGLLLVTDFTLAMSGVVLLTIIFVGVIAVSKPLRRRAETAQEADAVFSASLHQALTGIRTVRVSAQENAEARRLGRSLKGAVRTIVDRDVLHVWFGYTVGLAVSIGMYVILIIGAVLILRGQSTVGTLMAFMIYLTYVTGAVTGITALYPEVQRALASLQRIYKLMDEPTEHGGDEQQPLLVHGRVELDGVSFEYDDGTKALDGIDLVAEPGEVIAVVGRSGAGKSTLVNLIPRLYDPTEGTVRIDGVDVRELPLRKLRAQIGVVPQDVFLFNRTVRENIAYAAPGASDERIVAAARAAHAAEFIDELESGYDTLVGERGVKLSGGEKQRIAIAREILRDPPILILDEATSSLDSQSEALIKDAIDSIKQDRTCFVIAHRLSTVVDADRIAVLQDGRLIELGTHGELMARGGVYRGLYDTQFER